MTHDYIAQSNQNPPIFVWTASAESILAKIAKYKEALDALHYQPLQGRTYDRAAPLRRSGGEAVLEFG